MRLFYRLLITYVTIVIVILAILALVLSQSLAAYIYSQQQRRLAELGQTTSQQVLLYRQGQISFSELNQTVRAIDQSLNARVWVLDIHGFIILDSRSGAMHRRGSSYISPQYLGPLLKGEEIAQVVTILEPETQMLLVGTPVYSVDTVSGAVVLMTPVSDVRATLASIYGLFWPAAGLSLLAAILLALVVSRSISLPLKSLSDATVALAKGNFSRHVQPRGAVELRLLANSFNEMADQLKELEDMRRDLIASVSHELRSPLTSIRGFVQGVLDGKIAPDRQDEYLHRSLNEIHRLSSLVTNLLELSALEGKATPLELKQTDLREIINLSLAAMEPQLSEHQVSVEIKTPDFPLLATIDQQRLQQVIVNIISNSIKHTPVGISLKIDAGPVQDGFELRLADSGPGIPSPQLPHIFKPFFHGKEGGTGLGLSIARALVEAHGGTIHAANLPGGGSEFVIWLPRHT